MNVKPLADRILVRRIEEQETRKGGIIIPDPAKEKPQEGEIVAVGPGRMTEEGKRIAMEVKKGDRVLIGKYSGTDVKIDGTEYVILREDDVLGVLQSEKYSRLDAAPPWGGGAPRLKEDTWLPSSCCSARRRAPRFSTASPSSPGR